MVSLLIGIGYISSRLTIDDLIGMPLAWTDDNIVIYKWQRHHRHRPDHLSGSSRSPVGFQPLLYH